MSNPSLSEKKPEPAAHSPSLFRLFFTLERDRQTSRSGLLVIILGVVAACCSLPFVLPVLLGALRQHDPARAQFYRATSSYASEGAAFGDIYAAYKYARSVSIHDPIDTGARAQLSPAWCRSFLSASGGWMSTSSDFYPVMRKLRVTCFDMTGSPADALADAATYAGDVASGEATVSAHLPLGVRPSQGAGYFDLMVDLADYGRYAMAARIYRESHALPLVWGDPVEQRGALKDALAFVASPARCARELHARSVWRFMRFACGTLGSSFAPEPR
jgi:hypothetical protein